MWLARHLLAKPAHLPAHFLNITIIDCHATWRAKVNYVLLWKTVREKVIVNCWKVIWIVSESLYIVTVKYSYHQMKVILVINRDEKMQLLRVLKQYLLEIVIFDNNNQQLHYFGSWISDNSRDMTCIGHSYWCTLYLVREVSLSRVFPAYNSHIYYVLHVFFSSFQETKYY